MAFWPAIAPLLKTGQTTDYTPAGRTCKDDGGEQRGIVHQYDILTTGQFSGTTNITVNAKTDTHSNECVVDKRTGLMWSRTESRSIGPASDGKLLWDDPTNAEDIFNYCDQANLASLSGFSDWRIPNRHEFSSLLAHIEAGSAAIDTIAFPTLPTIVYWTSSTVPNGITYAFVVAAANGSLTFYAPVTVKLTGTNPSLLVRGR